MATVVTENSLGPKSVRMLIVKGIRERAASQGHRSFAFALLLLGVLTSLFTLHHLTLWVFNRGRPPPAAPLSSAISHEPSSALLMILRHCHKILYPEFPKSLFKHSLDRFSQSHGSIFFSMIFLSAPQGYKATSSPKNIFTQLNLFGLCLTGAEHPACPVKFMLMTAKRISPGLILSKKFSSTWRLCG